MFDSIKLCRVKMNRMRMKIASRLKEAQNTNAMLTTFNELDMSAIMQVAKFISVVYLSLDQRKNLK